MLGINEKPNAPAVTLIKDGTEATFLQDVIEPSNEVPVIVDFWAPWCAPCKTLGPQLEAAVTAAKGRVRMVKINVDQNQALAAQLRIQSLPTVYAFWQGKPADGFQGAVSATEVKRFVDQMAALAPEPDGGLADAIAAAEVMMSDGDFADAAETFAAVLEEEAENLAAYAGLARAHLAQGAMDAAQLMLDEVPPTIAKSKEMDALRAQIGLARQAATAGPEDDLRAAHLADPTNPQLMFDLALAQLAADKPQYAVDTLLALFKLDRDWNNGAARAQLFTIFDALKPQDPIVLGGRRRLSSMIFA